jgi:spoIIIJ-associated protein
LTRIIEYCGFRGKVELKPGKDGYYANIRTRSSDGLLIGRRGETLRALQYLVRAILKRRYLDLPRVVVDVGGYRMRRENFLRKKALAIARIVLETKREMALDPMTEREQGVVEEVLAQVSGVRSYTIGVGLRRNVIVAPK